MPQLIGRGEVHRASEYFAVPADRLLDVVLTVVGAMPDVMLDSHSRSHGVVVFSTRTSALGWGESVTASVSGDSTASRLDLSVSGRQRGGFLQLRRNRRLAGTVLGRVRRGLRNPSARRAGRRHD
ncbi:hypothetical protein [Actinomyces sp.]|uniref:hypothetical protein n=1 Tax=Actinomyces sp. TaxID=29317 RepID=UPI00289E8DF0|nr:hypothetical protein [Actinomyces sp.]